MPIRIPFTLAPGAHAPTRATAGAAGLDLCAYRPRGPVAIPPGKWARICTGVWLDIPAGFEGQIRPRSGLAYNHGLTVLNSPGTIDSDYRGELAVILVNHGAAPVTINHGDRIAQLVVCPVADVTLCPVDSLPPTARGEGGFGSTGTGTGPAPGSDDDRAMEADVSEGYAAGRIEERAAVVAYLRNLTSDWSGEQLADAIERGEHRAGGER